jgi:hypothetical protein
MNPPARSVFYFGIYLFITGLTLIFIPNVLLGMLQMPETDDVWIRVVGVLAFCLGFYYYQMAKANMLPFFKATIVARVLVFAAFTSFVLLKYVSPMLIIFGAIDLLGAIWTWISMPKKI